ncbi:anoctamin-8-like isoform X2 [Macrosteles quadrilineatus]|uniref:anoctamin-8-like isoform X2 n=1 Tax=Macrosteles quadrilineatus TaxID=74068 RepID=UPI0023E09746|nr:anoctamin-8-like isoform X2 [Macrosteles quadrilineatus]
MEPATDTEDCPSNNEGSEAEVDKQDDSDVTLRHRKIMDCAKETFESASRMLRRKIPCTGHLMTPRRLWIQTIPTHECDVVLMFPSGAQDFTLMWLLSRLRAGTPGLVVHVRHHSSSDSYGFYLTAPFNVLMKAAEELHLPKALRAEFGGGLKEFVQAEVDCFEGTEEPDHFFTTQERQWLVLHLLQTLRATEGDAIAGLKLIEGQAIVPKCLSAGIIAQVFPLHDLEALRKLRNTWVRSFTRTQPLDEVSTYFGVKIAMYFAWLGHYTTALIVPAIVGFTFWIGFGRGDQATEDVGFVLFAFFNVLWFSVYLEAWKRYCAELAYKWGTLDQRDELLQEPRPLFSGPLEVSKVTGRLEPTYPAWKRNVFRYFVSVPVIALCLVCVFIVMMLNLKLQDWWDRQIEAQGYAFCLSYLPKIMLAIGITLLDEAYYKVACWLNDKENYRLDTKYENHLIAKVAVFQFVNSFLSLFYIAFYLQDQEKLKEQLAALLIARQVIGNVKESALPYLLEQLRLAKMSFDLFGALSPSEAKREPPGTEQTEQSKSTNRNVSQAELESSLFKYDGTFADHLEMFIQLGYVVLFSSAFPLAALCAFINNLVEIRSDAFKLCFIFQRPFGQRVPNIGTWQNAMEAMGLIAVLVNCALIGLSGPVHRMFPEMSTTQTILLIVALEHTMLILRLLVTSAIPDLPEWVATEMAKVEFARREALRRLSTATPQQSTPPQPNQLPIGRFVVSPATEEIEVAPEEEAEELDTEEIAATVVVEEPPPPLPQDPPTPLTPPPAVPAVPPSIRRIHREWLAADAEAALGHHVTIGPSGGVEWVRRLGLEGVRKTSEPDMGCSSVVHRSTDCIALQHKDGVASSSDSDLLRSVPPWARRTGGGSLSTAPQVPPPPLPEPSTSDTTACDNDAATLAAKKQKAKQTFMKRARSVAIFSLKLKERRAKEAEGGTKSKEKEKPSPRTPIEPTPVPMGELSYIPIEKLIHLDDVRKNK